jgi:hypothetical protein
VALKEGRESVNGGRYDWAEAFGKGIMKIWEERIIWGLRDDIFLVLGVWFWSLGELLQGAPGCWEFWARGPGILTESWS